MNRLFRVALATLVAPCAWAESIDRFELTKPLDAAAVKELEPQDLRFLRNSIFARHGRSFDSASLATFFALKPWYKPDPKFSEAMLSEVEKANLALVSEAEKKRGGAWSETRYLKWVYQQLSGAIPKGAARTDDKGHGEFIPLVCGIPEAKLTLSQDEKSVIIGEDRVEGSGPVAIINLLIPDGTCFDAYNAQDPKHVIRLCESSSGMPGFAIDNANYGVMRELKKVETMSPGSCRQTGH